MNTRKRYIAFGVATFLIGALMLFPARAAYQWFVPEPVKLGGIGGSVWSGKAGEGLVAGIYFTDLTWSFKPLSLLTGQVAFDTSVTTTAGRIGMAIAVGVTGNVSLTDLTGSLSLAAIHPALKANRIEGTVNLQMQKLVLSDGWPTEAQGSVGIGDLVAGAIGPDTLGNFRADISTGDSGIVGQVNDAGAVLDVSGTLQLGGDRSYSLVGFVSANSETPAMINQNLRFLGTPDQNGQRQFRFEGSL